MTNEFKWSKIFLFGVLLTVIGCRNKNMVESQPLFELAAPEVTGITHRPTIHPRDVTGLVSGGGGVAIGDINNDGLPDLAFAGGLGALSLYLNKGDFRFEDITVSSRVNDTGPENKARTESLNLVDVNGDGWLDIYVVKSGVQKASGEFTSYGRNLLFINQRNNTFIEAGKQYNLDIVGLGISAHFFDYDRDGDLDVYLINNPEPGNGFSFAYYEGAPIDIVFNDRLFENLQGERFVEVTDNAGILRARNFGLSASISDVNIDGWLDIYVTNDLFGPDFLYINNGDKTFTEKLNTLFSQTPMSSMCSDFTDVDNDGWADLFIGEMRPVSAYRQKVNLMPFPEEIYRKLKENNHPQYLRNMLFRNYGGEAWRDIGYLCGVEATEWSWSSFFFDVDLDGWKDLFVVNGNNKDIIDMDWIESNFGSDYTAMGSPEAMSKIDQRTASDVAHPNFIFRNSGNLRFVEMNHSWGVDQPGHSKGATYADLDNDGDWDLIVHNLDTIPYLYRNTSMETGNAHFLKVRLLGNTLNKWSIGSRLEIYYGGNFQMMELTENRGFQSGPEKVFLFGVGGHIVIDSLTVRWIEGGHDTYYDLKVDTTYILKQKDYYTGEGFVKIHSALFQKDKLTGFDGVHRERIFRDFTIEKLIPRSYSSLGPAIVVADLDNDGRDDIVLGGGAGQISRMWLQKENGVFEETTGPWTSDPSYEVQDIAAFDANSDGLTDLYFACGSYEFHHDSLRLKDHLFLNEGNGIFTLAEHWIPEYLYINTKVAVPGDFDRDGHVDLFLGATVIPGDFGKQPSSVLLKNTGSRMIDVTESLAPSLNEIGIITDALWNDYDRDGDLDLVMVGEWLPMTILNQENGQFKVERNNSFPRGLWQSIESIDLDLDGDDDYLLGNFGLNTPWRVTASKPLSLVIGDLTGSGTNDPVLFHFIGDDNVPFVNRNIFLSHFPSMTDRFSTFDAYGKVNKSNLFSEEILAGSVSLTIDEARTGYMINHGNSNFSFHPLENEAQLAPVFDWLVFDINKDGYLEAIGGGNFSGFHYEHGAVDGSAGFMVATYPEIVIVPGNKLEYFGLPEVRKFAHIRVKNEDYILVGSNNGPVEVFKFL